MISSKASTFSKLSKISLVAVAWLVSSWSIAGEEIALGYNYLDMAHAGFELTRYDVDSDGEADEDTARVEKFTTSRADFSFDFCGSPAFIRVAEEAVKQDGIEPNHWSYETKKREFAGGLHLNNGDAADLYFSLGVTKYYGGSAVQFTELDREWSFLELGFRSLVGASRNWEIYQRLRTSGKDEQRDELHAGIVYHTAAGWSLGVVTSFISDYEYENQVSGNLELLEGRQQVSASFRINL